MKIYLDLCVYNRPFDDQGQPRVAIETMGFILLVEKAMSQEITVVNSFALEYENSKSPLIDRSDKIGDLLRISSEYVRYSERLESRAAEIERMAFMAMDALHIACAETVRADAFITCDDLLLRKGTVNKDKLKVKIIGLMEFISREVF
jgi:predicted nucleic acid-binding protein